jgi:hypothetical protein
VLALDNSALDPDHDSMSSVARAQLGENIGDMKLGSCLSNIEPVSDLFIGIPSGYQSENLNFPGAQFVICSVLGEFARDIGRDSLFSFMDDTDRVQKLKVNITFQ